MSLSTDVEIQRLKMELSDLRYELELEEMSKPDRGFRFFGILFVAGLAAVSTWGWTMQVEDYAGVLGYIVDSFWTMVTFVVAWAISGVD